MIARALGTVSFCLLLQCRVAAAYPDLDWKLYSDDTDVCFYEEHTLVHTHAGTLRVWTKCTDRNALDAAASDRRAPFRGAIIDMTAGRKTYGYQPPVLSVETLDRKQVLAAIRYEAVADLAGVAPNTVAPYELDCHGRRMRTLAGGSGEKPVPSSGWQDIPPKGAAGRLRRLLCR